MPGSDGEAMTAGCQRGGSPRRQTLPRDQADGMWQFVTPAAHRMGLLQGRRTLGLEQMHFPEVR